MSAINGAKQLNIYIIQTLSWCVTERTVLPLSTRRIALSNM